MKPFLTLAFAVVLMVFGGFILLAMIVSDFPTSGVIIAIGVGGILFGLQLWKALDRRKSFRGNAKH
jgi:hypothetical protein